MPTFKGPCTYADADGNHVMLTIVHENYEEPFMASKDADGTAGEAFTLAASGQLGTIAPFVPPASSTPSTISDRQFAQGLATWAGFGATRPITQAEALAWVKTGTLPAAIQSFVNGLPADDGFVANMLLSGATTFERAHPLVATFGQQLGMDSGALDAFWVYCSTL